MKKIMLGLLAAASLFAASCTKTGPQGPTGPQGQQGNANVRGSASFNVSTWIFGSNTYSANFTDADITADIVNYGAVEIFKYYPSDGSWSNLPDINGATSTVFNFKTGEFTIYISNIDNSVTPAPGVITFRAVAISSSLRQANPHTNWKNYNEAMAAINNAKAAGADL